MENKYYLAMSEDLTDFFFFNYFLNFWLQLSSYSVAAPDLFLLLLAPVFIRLISVTPTSEFLKLWLLPEDPSTMCRESAILNFRPSCPNLAMPGPDNVYNFLALFCNSGSFSSLCGFIFLG